MKIKKIKKCPKCELEVGRKTRTCKCGHKFIFKKPGVFEEIKNWKKLREGNVFYLTRKSRGPYYISADGTKYDMSDRGKYIVWKIEKDGIAAYNSEGLSFIYMGPKYTSELTNLVKRPYRIYKKS